MLSGTRLLSKHHHHLCGVNTLSVLLDARHIVFQKTSKLGQGHIPILNEPLIRLANQSWTPLILHGTLLPPLSFRNTDETFSLLDIPHKPKTQMAA